MRIYLETGGMLQNLSMTSAMIVTTFGDDSEQILEALKKLYKENKRRKGNENLWPVCAKLDHVCGPISIKTSAIARRIIAACGGKV